MYKILILIITLMALCVFISCSTIKYQSLDTISDLKGGKVTSIQKVTGEYVYFLDSTGIISTDTVKVKIIVGKEIAKEDITMFSNVLYKLGQIHRYVMITEDGTIYKLRSYEELDEEYAYVENVEEISIPISEIREIEILKKDRKRSGMWGLGIGFLFGAPLGVATPLGDYITDKEVKGRSVQNALIIGGITGIVTHHLSALIGVREKYILTAQVDPIQE